MITGMGGFFVATLRSEEDNSMFATAAEPTQRRAPALLEFFKRILRRSRGHPRPSCHDLEPTPHSMVQIRKRLTLSSTAASLAVLPKFSTANPKAPPGLGSRDICFTNLPWTVNSTSSLG